MLTTLLRFFVGIQLLLILGTHHRSKLMSNSIFLLAPICLIFSSVCTHQLIHAEQLFATFAGHHVVDEMAVGEYRFLSQRNVYVSLFSAALLGSHYVLRTINEQRRG